MSKHNFSLNVPTQNQRCNLCNTNVDAEKFRDHLIEHEMENGTITCTVCSLVFTSLAGLKDHIRDHNLTAIDLKEVCSKCSSRFLYPAELAHHLKEHELVENQQQTMKEDDEVESFEIKDIKEEEDDDYIEIEKVADNCV
jgi:DNA-directed RNA polymerase subunit RPC12/RpoP